MVEHVGHSMLPCLLLDFLRRALLLARCHSAPRLHLRTVLVFSVGEVM